jgi:hypothetical protein
MSEDDRYAEAMKEIEDDYDEGNITSAQMKRFTSELNEDYEEWING